MRDRGKILSDDFSQLWNSAIKTVIPEKTTTVKYEVSYPTLTRDPTMKLAIALASLAAFTYVGSQFSYAEDLLDTVLNTCIGYVHKQIPDSKFDAYIVDRSTGALNKFGTERDFVEFDKCKQSIWETIRQRTLEDKQKAISQYGKDPCVVNPALDCANK